MAGRQIEVRRIPTLIAVTVVEPPIAFPSWFRVAVWKVHHELRVDFFCYIIFSIKDLKMERFSVSGD